MTRRVADHSTGQVQARRLFTAGHLARRPYRTSGRRGGWLRAAGRRAGCGRLIITSIVWLARSGEIGRINLSAALGGGRSGLLAPGTIQSIQMRPRCSRELQRRMLNVKLAS